VEPPKPGGNAALRALLVDAGMSNAALARAVVVAGREQGVHLGTNTTSVRRMLDGAQPRRPVPRLVAKVVSRRLGYQVTVPECGFTDCGDPEDTPNDWFHRATSIGGTIRVVAELAGRDHSRRNLLLGSAFAAAAFAEPALLALTVPAQAHASRSGGGRIGWSDVEVFLHTIQHFEQLHRRFGGGAVHDQVVRLLHGYAEQALHGSYTDEVGRALFSTVAQATFLTALTSVDAGRHALAQRYFTQALHLAQQNGDPAYAANVLAEMSRLTIDVATARGAGDAQSRDAQYAVALARSAIQVAAGRTTPSLAAYLHVIEARSLVLLGDATGATTALDNARRAFDRPSQPEPDWLGYYGEPDLLGDLGQCMRDAGRPNQGLALLERALHALPAGRATARAKTQVHIAIAYLELGEHEQAAASTAQAIDAVGRLASNRIVDRLRVLLGRARLRRSDRHLAQLDGDLVTFLAGR
jgi:tetratricopeptide (TPR) repeat protein